MLDVGAVAARSGPPVAGRRTRRRGWCRRSSGSPREAGVPVIADTFSRRGRPRRRSMPAPSRSTTSAAAPTRRCSTLVAERGCGYVLMHIEGRPRVDREPRRSYDDLVDHLGRVVRRAARGRRGALASTPEQIALDPGLDFDLSVDDDLEILRRLGELRALGRPLYVALSRKDFLGAVLAGSWEERRAPAEAREWATAAATALAVADGRRDPAPARSERARRDAHRRGDRRAAVDSRGHWLRRRSHPGAPSNRPGGARRGRVRRPARRRQRRGAARGAERAPIPRLARAAPGGRRLRGAGIDELYSHQVEALEAAPGGRRDRHQRHGVGQVAVVQPAGARRARRRPEEPGALPLPDQGARAGPGAQARASSASRGLRHAIYDGDTPREDRPAIRRRSNLVLTNPDMLNIGGAPPPQGLGRLPRQPRVGGRRRGAHLPRRVRLARRQRAAPPAAGRPRSTAPSPRFVLASATIANPVELAERLAGIDFAARRLRRRAACRAPDRDVEPAGHRREDRCAGARCSPRRPSCSPTSSSAGCGRSASCAAGAASS